MKSDKQIILEKAKDNNLTCKVVSGDKQIYLYSKYYPKRNLIDIDLDEKAHYVILGVGLGYEITEILEKIYGRVYIIDYDRSFYEIVKNNDKLNAFLNDERVTFLFGDEYKKFVFGYIYKVYTIKNAVSLNEEFFREVLIFLKNKQSEYNFKITTDEKWKHRAEETDSSNNKKILFIHIFHRYIAKECADIFRKMGFDVIFLDYWIFEKKGVNTIIDAVLNEDPYIVFSINYINNVSVACEELNMYYISWMVDSPWDELYYRKTLNDKEFVFDFEKRNVEDIKRKGIKNIFHMPLAVNTKRIDKKIRRSDFIADVSFVANLHKFVLKDAMMVLDKDMISEIYKMIEIQNRHIDKYIIRDMINKDFCDRFFCSKQEEFDKFSKYISREDIAALIVIREQEYIFRINLVQALEEKFDFKLFGNDLWEDYARSYQGKKLDYFTEMPEVFNKSKININHIQAQFVTAIPLRVFDVLGSCGFLLTNYNEGLSEYFEDGKDIAVFKSIEEAVELAEFYLKHNELRYKMIESGYNKVKKYHTYEDRIEKMLKIVFE